MKKKPYKKPILEKVPIENEKLFRNDSGCGCGGCGCGADVEPD